jgi:hypothetical protein
LRYWTMEMRSFGKVEIFRGSKSIAEGILWF